MPKIAQTNEYRAMVDLINAYKELCPTVFDREYLNKAVKDMGKDKLSDREKCKHICSSIYDGLAYGNWPSAVKAMSDSIVS